MIPSNDHSPLPSPEDRLARSLSGYTQEPIYLSLWRNLKETISPPALPPLELTSRPIPVRDIWGQTAGNESSSAAGSVLIHGTVIALLLFLSTNKQVQTAVNKFTPLSNPLSEYLPKLPPKKDLAGGGGGGGLRDLTPPSKGALPKAAAKQYIPPQLQKVENPKVILEATILAQPDSLPKVDMPLFGDPLSGLTSPSQGPGPNGGFGQNKGNGVGPGEGDGYGPGKGRNAGGGLEVIGGSVSAPALLFKVEPEYSEEARKAKHQGTVKLSIIVDPSGKARDIRVIAPLGLGLDEKAIDAVLKWRFKPSRKDGIPVPVRASVEVNFRLL